MKVTLHEVAARAEVSIATASRALNGLPVSPANLSKVRGAALELGYVVNESARALRAERSLTMGLIFFDLRNTLGIDLLDALSEAIEAEGYSLIISTARGDIERYDVLMQRFLERRVDALFCIRPRGPGPVLSRYAAAAIPVITLFGGGGGFSALPSLTPVFSEAARALAAHLRGHGHARVAIVRPPVQTPPLAAIHETLRAQGFAVDEVAPSEAEGMGEVVVGLLARTERPTVAIATDPQIRGLVAACAAAGVATPADLSLVSVNEIATDAWHRRHGVTAVTIDPQRMGRAAAAAMLKWIAGEAPAERIRVQAAAFRAGVT